MNGKGAIRDRHTRPAVRAQNAPSVSGLAVARVLIGIAVPLDGVRVEVVVGSLDDGQPEITASCNRSATAAGFRIRSGWCLLNMTAKLVPLTDALQDWAM